MKLLRSWSVPTTGGATLIVAESHLCDTVQIHLGSETASLSREAFESLCSLSRMSAYSDHINWRNDDVGS